jgi:hypothetical protein
VLLIIRTIKYQNYKLHHYETHGSDCVLQFPSVFTFPIATASSQGIVEILLPTTVDVRRNLTSKWESVNRFFLMGTARVSRDPLRENPVVPARPRTPRYIYNYVNKVYMNCIYICSACATLVMADKIEVKRYLHRTVLVSHCRCLRSQPDTHSLLSIRLCLPYLVVTY